MFATASRLQTPRAGARSWPLPAVAAVLATGCGQVSYNDSGAVTAIGPLSLTNDAAGHVSPVSDAVAKASVRSQRDGHEVVIGRTTVKADGSESSIRYSSDGLLLDGRTNAPILQQVQVPGGVSVLHTIVPAADPAAAGAASQIWTYPSINDNAMLTAIGVLSGAYSGLAGMSAVGRTVMAGSLNAAKQSGKVGLWGFAKDFGATSWSGAIKAAVAGAGGAAVQKGHLPKNTKDAFKGLGYVPVFRVGTRGD
ncbi:MAG: hypothetical protein ACH36H_02100 [Candidatus Nanopelagicales bacterium]